MEAIHTFRMFLSGALALSLALAAGCSREEPAAAQAKPPETVSLAPAASGAVATAVGNVAETNAAITLVDLAGLEPGLVARICAQLRLDLFVHVADVNGGSVAKTEPAALLGCRSTPRPVFCRVVFWRGESDLYEGLRLLPDAKVVLVDVTPLLADGADNAKLEWRLIRQAARGTGLLLGLEYVAGPPCTLKRIRSLKELDALSRNFSPPAQGKFRQLIQLAGAHLIDFSDAVEEE